jgi:hypothetical protein
MAPGRFPPVRAAAIPLKPGMIPFFYLPGPGQALEAIVLKLPFAKQMVCCSVSHVGGLMSRSAECAQTGHLLKTERGTHVAMERKV